MHMHACRFLQLRCSPALPLTAPGPSCALCPAPCRGGGPMKRVDGGGWVHGLCANWCQETVPADFETLEPILGVQEVGLARLGA